MAVALETREKTVCTRIEHGEHDELFLGDGQASSPLSAENVSIL